MIILAIYSYPPDLENADAVHKKDAPRGHSQNVISATLDYVFHVMKLSTPNNCVSNDYYMIKSKFTT